MSVLDTILLAINAPFVLVLFVKKARGSWVAVYLTAVMAFSVIHGFIAPGSWQFAFIYIFHCILFFIVILGWSDTRTAKAVSSFLTLLAILCFATGGVALYIFPIQNFQESSQNSSAYTPGIKRYLFTDISRAENLTKQENDLREIPVTIFYPVKKEATISLSPDRYRYLLNAEGYPGFLVNHFSRITVNAADEALPAQGTYPLVMYSHDAPGMSSENDFLLRKLCASGMIVISIGHVYDSYAEVTPDGRIIPYNIRRLSDLNSSEIAKADYAVELIYGQNYVSNNIPPYAEEVYATAFERIYTNRELLARYLEPETESSQGRIITWEDMRSARIHADDISFVMDNLQKLDTVVPGLSTMIDAENIIVAGKGIGTTSIAMAAVNRTDISMLVAIEGIFPQNWLTGNPDIPVLYITAANNKARKANELLLRNNNAPGIYAEFVDLPLLNFTDSDILLPLYKALGRSQQRYKAIHAELFELIVSFITTESKDLLMNPLRKTDLYQLTQVR